MTDPATNTSVSLPQRLDHALVAIAGNDPEKVVSLRAAVEVLSEARKNEYIALHTPAVGDEVFTPAEITENRRDSEKNLATQLQEALVEMSNRGQLQVAGTDPMKAIAALGGKQAVNAALEFDKMNAAATDDSHVPDTLKTLLTGAVPQRAYYLASSLVEGLENQMPLDPQQGPSPQNTPQQNIPPAKSKSPDR